MSDTGRVCAVFGQHRRNSPQVRSNLVELVRHRVKIARSRPRIGRILHEFGRIQARFRGPMLAPLPICAMRTVLKRQATGKARGAYRWGPRELALLPDRRLDALGCMMGDWERERVRGQRRCARCPPWISRVWRAMVKAQNRGNGLCGSTIGICGHLGPDIDESRGQFRRKLAPKRGAK